MAGYPELFETQVTSFPKQVFLCVGELSSLVWDVVHRALGEYDFFVRVEREADLSFSLSGMGANAAYLLVDPPDPLLASARALIQGGGTEAMFILVSEDPSKYDKANFEYIKKKAQQSKNYYTITAPKADQAKAKMVSYFLMRWAVPRDTSHKVCSMLDYSPGRIYLFDKQFLALTGGQVLPSSQTQGLVDELLGEDTPNMVVMRILTGTPVDLTFDEAFTYQVLSFLHGLIVNAKMIQASQRGGNVTAPAISKDLGITIFQVVRSMGIANSYSPSELRRCEDLILFGFENVSGNPDLLSVISRTWS